jgi:hypothetical protein
MRPTPGPLGIGLFDAAIFANEGNERLLVGFEFVFGESQSEDASPPATLGAIVMHILEEGLDEQTLMVFEVCCLANTLVAEKLRQIVGASAEFVGDDIYRSKRVEKMIDMGLPRGPINGNRALSTKHRYGFEFRDDWSRGRGRNGNRCLHANLHLG